MSFSLNPLSWGFEEVASGEDEALMKMKRPEDKHHRPYHHPADRMIHYQYGRYQMAPDGGYMNTIEKSIKQEVDKYDYLIVFNNQEGKERDDRWLYPHQYCYRFLGLLGLVTLRPIPPARITYADGVKCWKHAATGGDIAKNKAEERFKQFWMEKFRGGEPSAHDTVPLESYQILVRELVIGILSGSSGLQLKLSQSKSGEEIYCRVRAPLQVLERQADLLKYPLKFRGEVDPGPEFWNEDECKEDSSEGPRTDNTELKTREDCEKVLQRLYEVGKLSPHDIEVFEDENKPKWMARVKALERVADKVPVWNPFPCYYPFSRTKSLRYVFEQYDSTRGPTLFLPKDRLFLTQSIMLRFMDLNILDEYGAIKGSMALHDANRGEYDDLPRLASQWVFPWTANKKDIGGVTIDSEYQEGDDLPSCLIYAWCQPLNEVRNYFGEETGFLFAWMGYLGYMFIFPAAFGLICQIYYWSAGTSWCEDGINTGTWFQMLTGIFIILWSVIFKNSWLSQEKLLGLKWGTLDSAKSERDRPQFRGTEYIRDPVTLREVLHYPESKRISLIVWSNVVMAAFIVALVVEIDVLAWVREEVSGGVYLANSIYSIQILFFTYLFGAVSVSLTETENYQTDTAFKDSLIFKTCIFEFVNRYGPLLYYAFIKEYTYGCHSDCCMNDVETLLYYIYAFQLLRIIYGLLEPTVAKCISDYRNSVKLRQAAAMREATADDDVLDSDALVDTVEPWEKEIALQPFTDIHFFMEYNVRCFNFGLAVMFVIALPLSPFVIGLFTMIRMRELAFKMCTTCQRPAPKPVSSIGLWNFVISMMCTWCILTNVGLLVFTSNAFREVSWRLRMVVFLAIVNAILAIQALVERLVPTESADFKTLLARHEFLIEKHVYGFQDLGSKEKGSSSAKRGHIDLGPLEEQILKKNEDDSADSDLIPELKALDTELESVKRELSIHKDKLQVALKNEVYNEKTGIGETIHGLPLGCLSLKLIIMEGVSVSAAKNVSVVVSLKSTARGDSTAPGPPAQVSKPGRPSSSDKKFAIDFNQTFTLAPIKSHEAQLIFDIMDGGADPKRRGTCKLHLRDLADQLDQNKTLNILVRQGAEGKFEPDASARLFARVKFQYSKVLPLRTKIYELQDTERNLRAQKTALRLSKRKN
jgi:hypothetical protein